MAKRRNDDRYAGLIRRYKTRPDLFFKDLLSFTPWEKQREIAYSVRDNKETYVQSCNSAGKSEIAAAVVLWWIMTRESKVVTTAPTWRQVQDVLWSKIGKLARRNNLLGIKPLQTRIEIANDWYATGLSTREPDKFQGYHGNVLIVVDEACGVEDPDIWAAIDGNITGRNDRLLAIGNPTNPDTPFGRRCLHPTDPSTQKVIKISAYDTPNVQAGREIIPGMVTLEWCHQKLREWGENSAYYKARVLGEFPENVSDSLFPLAWMERAFNCEDESLAVGEGVIGFDIALGGVDNNALCYRTGGKVHELRSWQEIDTTKLVYEGSPSLFEWVDRYMPRVVYMDANGPGKPIYDMARRYRRTNPRYRGVYIRPFVAQASPRRPAEFVNRKAEAYINFRELLRLGRVDLSSITGEMRETLERQANAVRGYLTPKGLWQVEPKEKMRSRVGFSPDELESLIMAFYTSESPHVVSDAYARFEYKRDDSFYGGGEEGKLVADFEYGDPYAAHATPLS